MLNRKTRAGFARLILTQADALPPAERIRLQGFAPAALCSGEGDGGAGGSGAPGSGAPGDATFNQGQIDQLNGIVRSHIERLPIGQLVNEAVKNVLPGLTETMAGTVKELVGKALEGFKPPPGAPGDGKGGDGQTVQIPDEIQNLIKKQAADIEELKQQATNSQRALEAAKADRDENEKLEQLRAALSAAGVKDVMMPAVLALKRAQVQRSEVEENGTKVVKLYVPVKKTSHGQEFTENQPLAKWAKEWVATDEGKHYLPAKKAGGSGQAAGASPGGSIAADGTPLTADGKVDHAALERQIGEGLLAAVTGQVIDDI